MEPYQLRLLRELGELGSVRAVAEAVHVTPSAVSQQLNRLQQSLGVALVRREGRYLKLTEAGVRLAEVGGEVETALAKADEVAAGFSVRTAGTVRVSAFNSAALMFFPALVHRFPAGGDVDVVLADEDVPQAEFPALAGRYEVVISHRFEHTAHWPSTLAVTPLLLEPLDVAVPVDHPLAQRGYITARAAAAEPWIATHAGFPVGAIVDALAAVAGRPVRVVHTVNEFTVAAELVRAGAGLALIPRWAAPPPTGVVLRRLAGVRSARRIDALCRPESHLRPTVRDVLRELQRIAKRIARPQPGSAVVSGRQRRG